MEAIRTGQSYFLSDIPAALIEERAQDAEHARLVRQLGLRSFIVAPMVARGRVLGVLTFAAAESGRCYAETDVVFAEDLARRAATAIENARLYAEVRESEERFCTMADSAPVLIWLSDINKACTWCNHPWLEFTGRTLEQEFGSGWVAGVHPEDVALCVATYNTAFERRDPFVREYRLRRWDGEWRWVLDQGIPRSTPEGTFAGYIGSCIDITERRQMEDALRKANAVLEEFAYVVSHDLQEPLRMVNTYTQKILRRVLSEEAREYGEFIRKGVLRMQELIEDLLGYSRMIHTNTLPDGTADLSESLSVALRTLTGLVEEATITSTTLPVVRGDHMQLIHVFQNLLSNSLKYRQAEVPPKICISAEREKAEWIISVQDNGIGFEQKYAEQVFGLFKRLHKDAYPGTGLGLAICQRIVERSGGRMWARSSPEQGATFFFSLPTAEAE